MKKLLYIMGLVLLMASCSEDFEDWVNPQHNDPAPLQAELTVDEVDPIDFSALEEDIVQAFVPTLNVQESDDVVYTVTIYSEDKSATREIKTDKEGKIEAAKLETAITSMYGKAPVEHKVAAAITAVTINGQTFKTEKEFSMTVTPNAPILDTVYYITGEINGWDNANTDYEVANSGQDPYEDPVFKITLAADVVESVESFEFKLTPVSGLGGDWSGCFTAGETEGKLADKNAGGNIKVEKVPGAKFYTLSFNLLDMTWKCETMGIAPFIYEIGNESGWSEPHALALDGQGAGIYTGFYFLNGEFKFKPNKNDWNGDWEFDGVGKIADNGSGQNCPAPETGFYKIVVNINTMSYDLVKINTVGVIGSATAGGWNSDQDMSWNPDGQYWHIENIVLTDGAIKFRGNDNWDGDLDLGGDINDLRIGAGDIVVTAGTYDIKLYASYEGASYCVMTKK